MSIGRTGRSVLLGLTMVAVALPAAAQTRRDPAGSSPRAGTMEAGLALGAAGVAARSPGSSWDFGPLVGARWRWAGERSGAFVAVDVQPLYVSGGSRVGRYRAAWLLPAYEIRRDRGGIRAGLGLGMFRFEQAQFGDRTDFASLTGVSGTVRLSASFALELSWRRTGLVRGIGLDIWSLQMTRLWPL